MDWEDVPETIDAWSAAAREPAQRLRKVALAVPALDHNGIYWNPHTKQAGVLADDDSDRIRLGMAIAKTAGVPAFLSVDDLGDPAAAWIKVAYSPTLRQLGEALNFFPGQYPGGLPNSPSPLAAMLTAGLVGAGLGWGTGRLAEKLLPDGYGRKLGRTGALLGGALGAIPGALWAGTNKIDNRPWNDPALLEGDPENPGSDYENASLGMNALPPPPSANVLPSSTLREMWSARPRTKASGDTFGTGNDRWPSPSDVNIDHVGRTLWEGGASPALTATTMSALYAARQLPDPDSEPGIVTGRQLGTLAARSIGNYARGLAVGAAINSIVGTPYSAPAFGVGSVALGMLGQLVPKLFGN